MKLKKQDLITRFCTVNPETNLTYLTPIVVSKRKKVLYFHIAKTGGSSITKLMNTNGFNDNILTNRKISTQRKIEYFEEIVDHWDDYYKFTFVRNKFDQLVSLYHYDKNAGLLNDCNSFSDFIINKVKNDKNLYGDWLDQYYLTHINENNMFNFIGTFKNYENDMRVLCKQLGVEYRDVRENIGSYNRTRNLRELYDNNCENIVREKFEKEINHFNWDLNNG